jgi:hypothetical protein
MTTRTLTRLLFAIVSVAGTTLAPAALAGEIPRVAVDRFRGPQAARIQGAVETGLVGRYYVVPDFNIAEVARRKGIGLVVDDEFATVGKALDVQAFVSAQIQKRSNWQVALLVRRGDTGAPMGRILVTDRRLDRLERQLTQRTSRRLQALLARTGGVVDVDAGPGEAPSLSEKAPVEEEAEESGGGGGGTPGEVLTVSLDGRLFTRSFSYAQNLTGLPEYKLGQAFATALDVSFHPGALFAPAAAPLGIIGSLEYGMGVGSRVSATENRRSSDVSAYSVGLEFRLRFGAHELTPQASYGARSFTTGEAGPRVPDVRYKLLNAGMATRLQVMSRLALLGQAAFVHVLDAGPLMEPGRFTRATVRGLEAQLGVSFAMAEVLELRATGGMRRLGFDMNAQPGDAWVAGGAIDQTVWGGLGLVYRPRAGGSSSSAAAASTTVAKK